MEGGKSEKTWEHCSNESFECHNEEKESEDEMRERERKERLRESTSWRFSRSSASHRSYRTRHQ